MPKTLHIRITEEMEDLISIAIVRNNFIGAPEFIRHCIRQYFDNLEFNDENSLMNDMKHWNAIQKKINKLPDKELLSMMTSSISVKRMERITQNEIIKRLYQKISN